MSTQSEMTIKSFQSRHNAELQQYGMNRANVPQTHYARILDGLCKLSNQIKFPRCVCVPSLSSSLPASAFIMSPVSWAREPASSCSFWRRAPAVPVPSPRPLVLSAARSCSSCFSRDASSYKHIGKETGHELSTNSYTKTDIHEQTHVHIHKLNSPWPQRQPPS